MWKSTSVSGARSRLSAMTCSRWFRRAVRNRHRHAIEQVSACRVDGVEVDATIQHERAVKFDFHTGVTRGRGKICGIRCAIIATCAPAWEMQAPAHGRRGLGLLIKQVGQHAAAATLSGILAPSGAHNFWSTASAASPAVPSVPRTDAASAYVSDVKIVDGGMKPHLPVSANPPGTLSPSRPDPNPRRAPRVDFRRRRRPTTARARRILGLAPEFHKGVRLHREPPPLPWTRPSSSGVGCWRRCSPAPAGPTTSRVDALFNAIFAASTPFATASSRNRVRPRSASRAAPATCSEFVSRPVALPPKKRRPGHLCAITSQASASMA